MLVIVEAIQRASHTILAMFKIEIDANVIFCEND